MFLFQSPQHLSTDRISLRLFRITFAAYLPTHIKFLTEFHRIFFGIMAQKKWGGELWSPPHKLRVMSFNYVR